MRTTGSVLLAFLLSGCASMTAVMSTGATHLSMAAAALSAAVNVKQMSESGEKK